VVVLEVAVEGAGGSECMSFTFCFFFAFCVRYSLSEIKKKKILKPEQKGCQKYVQLEKRLTK
jgi:hypothetical protein